MEAVFVNNPSEQAIRSPQQVMGAFLSAWPLERVDAVLWEVFALASIGGLGGRAVLDADVLPAEEVASLFDQLIALVKACERLQQQGGAHLLDLTGGKPHV